MSRKTLPWALVLAHLLDAGELYGLEIIKRTGFKSGAIYPILDRLLDEAMVTLRIEDGDQHVLNRPLRRFFRLTDAGQEEARRALSLFPSQLLSGMHDRPKVRSSGEGAQLRDSLARLGDARERVSIEQLGELVPIAWREVEESADEVGYADRLRRDHGISGEVSLPALRVFHVIALATGVPPSLTPVPSELMGHWDELAEIGPVWDTRVFVAVERGAPWVWAFAAGPEPSSRP